MNGPENHGQQTKAAFSPRFWILLAAIVAITAKLFLAWNTIGTNDTIVFFLFGRELSLRGLVETYRRAILFNHPPLVAYYLRGIYEISHSTFFEQNRISFALLLRLPGIIADSVSTIVVWKLAGALGRRRPPFWALLLFSLNPISVMVNGFHGNTDSVMVMFLLLACLMSLRERALLSGLFFGLSCQIKIIPLLFLPPFLFFWYQRRLLARFVGAFGLATLLLILQPLLFSPVAYARNVLAYGSYWGLWGLSYLMHLSRSPHFSRISFFGLPAATNIVSATLKFIIVCGVVALAWRRRGANAPGLLFTVAGIWLIFFIVAPGIAPQYFVWLLPFLLFLSPVFFASVVVTGSIFIFIFYTTISHGLPWYFGVSTNALSAVWAPWSLLPWMTLILGGILIWRNSCRRNGLAKLFALKPAAIKP